MVQKKARAQDYTPEERLAIIMEGMVKGEPVTALAARYGISRETYYTWQQELKEAVAAIWPEQPAGRKPKGYLADLTAARKRIEDLEAKNAALAAEKKALEKQYALTDLRLLSSQIIINRVPDELKKKLGIPLEKEKLF